MNPPPTKTRPHLRDSLGDCRIPTELLPTVMDHVTLLDDIELQEVIRSMQRGNLTPQTLIEVLSERSNFQSYHVRLPWVGNTEGFCGPCVADLECLCEYSPFPNVFDRYARDVAVLGKRAYIAAKSAGLIVADISTPTQPMTLGRLKPRGCGVHGVAVVPHKGRIYALVALANAWEVVDVTNPSHFDRVWKMDGADCDPWDITIIGSCAVLASGDTGVEVFEITNPRVPSRMAKLKVGGHPLGIAAEGTCAFVANGEALIALDMSDPFSPRELGRVHLADAGKRLVLGSGYAYVFSGGRSAEVIDVRNPSNMVLLGSCDLQDRFYGGVIEGDFAFLADIEYGLRIFKVQRTEEPFLFGPDVGGSVTMRKQRDSDRKATGVRRPSSRGKGKRPDRSLNTEAKPEFCTIELEGLAVTYRLDVGKQPEEVQSFERLWASTRLEIRFKLPEEAQGALHLLRSGLFDPSQIQSQNITPVPGSVSFAGPQSGVVYRDWMCGIFANRDTWRSVSRISSTDRRAKRTDLDVFESAGEVAGFYSVTIDFTDDHAIRFRRDRITDPNTFSAASGGVVLDLLQGLIPAPDQASGEQT